MTRQPDILTLAEIVKTARSGMFGKMPPMDALVLIERAARDALPPGHGIPPVEFGDAFQDVEHVARAVAPSSLDEFKAAVHRFLTRNLR